MVVLGYGFTTAHSVLANRRPEVKLLDSTGKVISENHPKTADDTIFLNGILASGIPLSVSLRGGSQFKGQPGLDWRIYGSTGEIRITAQGPFLQIGYPDMMVEVHDYVKDELKNVVFEEGSGSAGSYADLPIPGRNVGRVYEALKEGRISCTFEDAVERHEFIEELYKENGYTEA